LISSECGQNANKAKKSDCDSRRRKMKHPEDAPRNPENEESPVNETNGPIPKIDEVPLSERLFYVIQPSPHIGRMILLIGWLGRLACWKHGPDFTGCYFLPKSSVSKSPTV